MARYWLGPWVWEAVGPLRPHWRMPDGAQSAIDLRSPVEAGQAITPTGSGLFVTPDGTHLDSSYRSFGTDLDAVLSGTQKNAWRSILKLRGSLAAQDLRGAVWETLTIQADPTGLDCCRPIVPAGRTFELWLGGKLQMARPLGESTKQEWKPVLDQLKREYRQLRQEVMEGLLPADHHRKVCCLWARKYGRSYREFQPSDLPDETEVEPSTLISENFNTPDSSTLGPQLTWTETEGNWDIHSNAARVPTSADSSARAETDLSSADHYCQVLRPNGASDSNSWAGPAVRYSPTATTFYRVTDFLANFRIGKTVAQVDTFLFTGVSFTRADNDTYKVSVNGSSLQSSLNGTIQETGTDTSITGNLRTGITGALRTVPLASAAKIDNFEASDLAVSSTINLFDSSNVAESVQVAFGLDLANMPIDSINAAEQVTVRLEIDKPRFETVMVTESIMVSFIRTLSVFEDIQAADVVGNRLVTANRLVSDAPSILESVTVTVAAAPPAPLIQVVTNDAINIAESSTVSRPGVGDALDSVTVGEFTAVALNDLILSVNEASSVTESITMLHAHNVPVIQELHIDESFAVLNPVPALSFFEAIAVTEQVVVAFFLDVHPVIDMVNDSVTVSESVTVMRSEGIAEVYVPRRPDIPSPEGITPEPYIPRRPDVELSNR